LLTNLTRSHRLATGIVFLLAIAAFPAANASVIIPGSSNQGSAIIPGTGLAGTFWDSPDDQDLSNLATADTVSSGAVTATFLATTIDYPDGATDSVSTDTLVKDFLGVDAATLSPSAAGDLTILRSVLKFTGFIEILAVDDIDASTPEIELGFSVGSDDGFRLRIGGVLVSQFDGLRGFSFTSETAVFAAPGLYAIDLLYFEGLASSAGFAFASSIGGSAANQSIVPADRLFTSLSAAVPEPASLALCARGGAVVLIHRRLRAR
jgi:hypothetical protein